MPQSAVPEADHSDDAIPEIMILTGMAGSGRETAAHAVEDLGWYVVNNIPPVMLPELYDLMSAGRGEKVRLAAVIDTRTGPFFSDLPRVLDALAEREVRTRLIFLVADDDTLLRRFDSVRRPHPNQNEGGVLDGIRAERELLAPLKKRADMVINTSAMNVHQLSMRMRAIFGRSEDQKLTVNVVSFGFKYGLPSEADHIADVRFIPNPYWVPGLRELRGVDQPVADFVFGQDNAREFLEHYLEMIDPVLRGYKQENKHFTTLAIGCTGGKHRSVAMAEAIGKALAEKGNIVRVRHRDMGRE